ncbi:MAG: glycosyltransferase family 2 protein [Mycobacteriales bacterium]
MDAQEGQVAVSGPDVSVIIPVRDDVRGLRRCLDALAVQEQPPSYEVVVGLDRPSAGIRALLAERRAEVMAVESPGAGSYAARNAAVAASRGGALAFVDADTVPRPTWLASGAERVQVAGVVGGAVVPLLGKDPSRVEEFDAVMHLRQQDHVEVGFAATANLWVTREAWDEVGAFDPSLLSGGDLQWGQRAVAAGHVPVYAPKVVVEHRTRSTLRELAAVQSRIAAGWFAMADPRTRLRPWREPALTTELTWINERAGRRRDDRALLVPYIVCMGARWWGWLYPLARQSVARFKEPTSPAGRSGPRA